MVRVNRFLILSGIALLLAGGCGYRAERAHRRALADELADPVS